MSQNDWFASWFDTPYYHLLYRDRDQQEAERFVRNLVKKLDIEPGKYILDLACGKGRHSLTLAESGYRVLGADLSVNSIENAKKLTLPELDFRVHDMRQPIPDHEFDAVFNLFTSFGYFDSMQENEEVIRSVHSMLVDNGLFVIDFMNAARVIEELVSHEEKIVDAIHFEIERSFDGTHIFKKISFSDKGHSMQFTERVQALTIEDFKTLLENHGFTILRTFGNLEMDAFDEETSDRLILIAEKQG